MLYIESQSTDPHFNLALEEYLFYGKQEEVFMLWQNDKSIIIGKNQNAMAEIDYEYVTSNNIPVVRRLTGGGAVYHDLGNVNFTYITNREAYGDYVGFTKALRDFLETLGLSAVVSGRNDVLVEGKKISGNAQYSYHGRLLHHGTILISADMTHLAKALRPDEEKIKSKGIRSVQSRVMNMGERINMDSAAFRTRFGRYVMDSHGLTPYSLSEEELEKVHTLQKEKYDLFSWNYGYSPKYSFHTKKRLSEGSVEVYLDIQNGTILDAKIFGDFLFDAEPLMQKLCGIKHEAGNILAVLSSVNTGSVQPEELLSCFL